MKGEHVIDDTGDGKDTGAKGKCNSAEENLKWKKKYETVMFNIEFLRFHQTKLYWFYKEIRLIS